MLLKKIVVIAFVLLCFSSCYINNVDSYSVTIVDNGIYSDGRHIIGMSAPSNYEKIRYTIDGGTPSTKDSLYDDNAKTYEAVDGRSYNGILVSVGSTVKAVSYKTSTYEGNSKILASFIGELTVKDGVN